MTDAECIRNCYESNTTTYYKKGIVYSIDEKLFNDMGFLKYFRPLQEATRVSVPVGDDAKKAVGRPKKDE